MPDISMCDFKKCKKSQDCFRFKAIPDKYQSYIVGMEKICNEENDYEYFLEVRG